MARGLCCRGASRSRLCGRCFAPAAPCISERRLRGGGRGGGAFVVADARVARLWGGDLTGGLGRAGVDWTLCAVPPGERSKNLTQARRLLEWLSRPAATRGGPGDA